MHCMLSGAYVYSLCVSRLVKEKIADPSEMSTNNGKIMRYLFSFCYQRLMTFLRMSGLNFYARLVAAAAT